MRVGDLVRYQDRLWIVNLVDPFRLGLAALARDQTVIEVPHDTGEVEIIANPSETWPFISPPARGVVQNLKLARGARIEDLTPYEDWVIAGTSLFFRPSLAVKVGDVFMVGFGKSTFNLSVKRKTLATLAQRKEMQKPKPAQEPLSAYARILLDNDDD